MPIYLASFYTLEYTQTSSNYLPVGHSSIRHVGQPLEDGVHEVPGVRLGRHVGDEVEVEREVSSDLSFLVPVVKHRHGDVSVTLREDNPEENDNFKVD